MVRAISVALAGLLLGGCLVAVPAFAADVTWADGLDLDCASCHVNEATAESADEDAGEDAGDAAKDAGGAEANAADSDATAGDDAAGEGAANEGAADAASLIEVHSALACVACHDDEQLAELHEGATVDDKMPKKLKKTEVSEELCLTCHDSEQLAEATADRTILTDDDGTVVNPHDLPDVSDHDPITCISCHVVHGDETVEETAPAKCLSCHHENVYECGTCH